MCSIGIMVRTTLEIEKSTLEILKEIGRKNQTYDDLIRRRIKCDNLDCQDAGLIEVPIDNQKFGTISLFVCRNCLWKFQN